MANFGYGTFVARLYDVDLPTGAASLIGNFSRAVQIADVAIALDANPQGRTPAPSIPGGRAYSRGPCHAVARSMQSYPFPPGGLLRCVQSIGPSWLGTGPTQMKVVYVGPYLSRTVEQTSSRVLACMA